jgi:hypothetical protein
VNSVTVSGRVSGPAPQLNRRGLDIALADPVDGDRRDDDHADPVDTSLKFPLKIPLPSTMAPMAQGRMQSQETIMKSRNGTSASPQDVRLHEERGARREADGQGHEPGRFPRDARDAVAVMQLLMHLGKERPEGVAGEPVGERQVDRDGGSVAAITPAVVMSGEKSSPAVIVNTERGTPKAGRTAVAAKKLHGPMLRISPNPLSRSIR